MRWLSVSASMIWTALSFMTQPRCQYYLLCDDTNVWN